VNSELTLACSDVQTIELNESNYNNSGALVNYGALAIFGYNSNSFTYTLLNNVNLSSFFGSTLGWTPGWSQLVPGL
jgi:hypothetical protein